MTDARSRRPLRICLAASGGGHVRQLLDLEPVWGEYDHFFVGDDTILNRSLAAKHRTYFVAHYALGQARLGKPFKMLRGAVGNFVQAARIIRRERPDVVISTGAGTAFWAAFFARMQGATFILIESFARFHAPSKFGRLAARFADYKIVQSEYLKDYWKDALLFDPFRYVDGERPEKSDMVFATVGATLPFSRLTDSVIACRRDGAITGELIVQVGDDIRTIDAPLGTTVVRDLGFDEIRETLKRADIVISHGGTGSIITALREGCKVVAMPRLVRLGEVYDDHQEEIVEAFRERGLVETASTTNELSAAIARARAKPAVMATTDPAALSAWLKDKLSGLAARKEGASA